MFRVTPNSFDVAHEALRDSFRARGDVGGAALDDGQRSASRRDVIARSLVGLAGVGVASALISPQRAAAEGTALQINVAEYGTLGTSNDSATFQAALDAANAAGGAVVVAPYGSYRVTNLRVKTGTKLWFPGVKLVNINPGGVETHCMTLVSTSSDVLVYGVEIDGHEGGTNTSGIIVEGTRHRITGAYIHDTPQYGINISSPAAPNPATTHITVDHCRTFNAGVNGLTIGSAGTNYTQHVLLYANHIKDCGHASISCVGQRLTVANNVTEETLPIVGSVADSFTAYSTGNSDIICVGNSFYTSHNQGIHVAGNRLTIVANEVIEPAQSGIYVVGHFEHEEVIPSADFLIADNLISAPGVRDEGQGYGIYAERGSGGVIANNEINTPRTHGVVIGQCDTVSIMGNTIRVPQTGHGVEVNESQRVAVCGNMIYDAHLVGVQIDDPASPASTDVAITGNVINDSGSGGVNVVGGLATRVAVADNTITGNSGSAVSLNGSANKTGANFTDTSATVASAATLGVSRDVTFATVTGTTTITSMSSASAEIGRVLALRFKEGCTIQDGGNLILASTFVAPANAIIVLVCDGTNWYETARSLA
jgi:hypothetical protein